MPKKISLQQDLGRICMRLAADFQARLDADLVSSKIPGLPSRFRGVMIELGRNGPSRAADLARALSITPQSMMSILNEMESADLIARGPDPADSRAKLIDFTECGHDIIDILSASTERVWQQYAHISGEKELQSVFTLLRDIVDNSTTSTQEDCDE